LQPRGGRSGISCLRHTSITQLLSQDTQLFVDNDLHRAKVEYFRIYNYENNTMILFYLPLSLRFVAFEWQTSPIQRLRFYTLFI